MWKNTLRAIGDADSIKEFRRTITQLYVSHPEHYEKLMSNVRNADTAEEHERALRALEAYERMYVLYELFNSTVPVPAGDLDVTGWRLENWGTAKEVREFVYWLDGEQEITIEFSSDNPPIAWVLNTSELFPGLVFSLTYNEPARSSSGGLIVSSGKLHKIAHLRAERQEVVYE